MEQILYGALGVLLVLMLLSSGFLLGWWASNKARDIRAPSQKGGSATEPEAEDEKIKEQRRMIEEENKALKTLLHYNVDMAYGANADLTAKE